MTWTEIPWGAVLTLVCILSAVGLLALDERNRRKFASRASVCLPDGTYRFLTREDAAGMVRRLEDATDALGDSLKAYTTLFTQLDDRTGDLEEKVAIIDERQTQQWGRIGDQMLSVANTIREVTAELKDTQKAQQEFALRLERMQRD